MRGRFPVASLLYGLTIVAGAAPGAARVTAGTPPPLGLTPHDCSTAPRLVQFDKATAPGVGSFPIWAVGFSGPRAHLAYGNNLNPRDYAPGLGWGHKFLWVSKVGYTKRVTIQGGSLDGSVRLLWGGQQRLILEPWHSAAFSGSDRSWSYFPSSIYVPRAGCYYLTANWPGGRWRITFAVGR